MPEYWAAHGQPIVHLERGAYGPVTRPLAYVAIAVVLLPYLGRARPVRGRHRVPAARPRCAVLLLGFLVFYVLLHVASHGYPRYRLPSLPVLFLVARPRLHGVAHAPAAGGRPRARRSRPPRSPSRWRSPSARASSRGRRGRGRRRGSRRRRGRVPRERRRRRRRSTREALARDPARAAARGGRARARSGSRRCARRSTATRRSSA